MANMNDNNTTIYKSLLLFIAILFSSQANAFTDEENRNRAECGVRAMIFQHSVEAYTSQSWNKKFRSQNGAVSYVAEKTSKQNLKKKEGQALISRTVKYVYEVMQPQNYSDNKVIATNDFYYKNCMFDPENAIKNFYIVDWEKANSINTDGVQLSQNKDGSLTVCSKGKCEVEYPPPQGGIYEDVRKKIISQGWTPAPSALKPILIKTGELHTNGNKLNTNEAYGNCLTENSVCDKSKPELAECSETNECTAVWVKDGETISYLIEDGQIVQYSSTPKGFLDL